MQQTFAIVGGGIAGLTTAIALRKIGIKASVFEAAPEIKAIGAGLGLAANAIKAFHKLGIAEEINARGKFLSNFTIYDQKGKAITAVESTKISKKYGLDNFTIHRASLHQYLLSQIDPDTVHKHKRVIAIAQKIEQKAKRVIIKFQDGTTHETDFLIGADGIHSPIRLQLLPDINPDMPGIPVGGQLLTTAS